MKKLEKGLIKVMKGLLSMSLRYDIYMDALLKNHKNSIKNPASVAATPVEEQAPDAAAAEPRDYGTSGRTDHG